MSSAPRPSTPHLPDGSDPAGDGLTITIRIGPDGRVYFHDITAPLLPVALSLDPANPDLSRRALAAHLFRPEPTT